MTTEVVKVEPVGVTLDIDGRVIIANFTSRVECGEFVQAVWYRLDGKLLSFNDVTCEPKCTAMRFELMGKIPIGTELNKALADVQYAIVETLDAINEKAGRQHKAETMLPPQRRVEVDLRHDDELIAVE